MCKIEFVAEINLKISRLPAIIACLRRSFVVWPRVVERFRLHIRVHSGAFGCFRGDGSAPTGRRLRPPDRPQPTWPPGPAQPAQPARHTSHYNPAQLFAAQLFSAHSSREGGRNRHMFSRFVTIN